MDHAKFIAKRIELVGRHVQVTSPKRRHEQSTTFRQRARSPQPCSIAFKTRCAPVIEIGDGNEFQSFGVMTIERDGKCHRYPEVSPVAFHSVGEHHQSPGGDEKMSI